jgi:hypothetical protein
MPTDVPAEVQYGQVIGRFVSFTADSYDAGNVPDEVPLNGKVILTPLTTITRWPTTTPPRLAIAQPVTAVVIDGTLTGPDGLTNHLLYLVATDQPEGQPDTIQWRASFRFDGVTTQPADVVFDVPAGGVVDLGMIASIPPEPPAIVVVSHEDALAAAASAEEAAQSVLDAQAVVDSAPLWWQGTQAEYAALATKDPATLYVITS